VRRCAWPRFRTLAWRKTSRASLRQRQCASRGRCAGYSSRSGCACCCLTLETWFDASSRCRPAGRYERKSIERESRKHQQEIKWHEQTAGRQTRSIGNWVTGNRAGAHQTWKVLRGVSGQRFPARRDEKPKHEVEIGKPFLLGNLKSRSINTLQDKNQPQSGEPRVEKLASDDD